MSSINATDINIPAKAFLPCYKPLIDEENDIELIWGGRDSGKTHFVAQKYVMKMLGPKKFRGVLIRKTFNSIHDSQFQAIKDVVESWGLRSLFRFKEAPLSIECVSGNRCICRGCDDTGNLKSIKDPTDCWYEEGNQLSQSEFITVATTLRSNHGKVKQILSFNPECAGDYTDFWLYKLFFAPYKGNIYSNFTSNWTIPTPKGDVVFTYRSTHTTYNDNRYATDERIALLEQLQFLDPHYYTVFTQGLWGNQKVNSPFVYSFDRTKHIRPTKLTRLQEVYLSFDFNLDPITCGVYQHYNNWIYGIENIALENSDIYKLCDYLNIMYRGCLFVVTGDATGRNTTALVQDGINYYTVIKTQLSLASGQIKTPTVNPKVKENRVLVNAVMHSANVALDPVKCKALIYDMENVSVNDVGDIEKGSRSNPKKRADSLDNFRYYLNSFHKHLLRETIAKT